MFERVRKGTFKFGDTCAFPWWRIGVFRESGTKQRLQSRGNRMGTGNGMGHWKSPTVHSHISSAGICWKCHRLLHLWPLGLSYPSHPDSSLHLCPLSYFLDLKCPFRLLPLCSCVLRVPCTSRFNGMPAAFFSLPKNNWNILATFAKYQADNWVSTQHVL